MPFSELHLVNVVKCFNIKVYNVNVCLNITNLIFPCISIVSCEWLWSLKSCFYVLFPLRSYADPGRTSEGVTTPPPSLWIRQWTYAGYGRVTRWSE